MTDKKWDVFHHMHLVYYSIKHNLSEEETLKYFTEQMDRCEKMLKNVGYRNTFYADLDGFEEILNFSDDDFTLKHRDEFQTVMKKKEGRSFYEYVQDEDTPITTYWYERKYARLSDKEPFKQVSEHTLYLTDERYIPTPFKNCTKSKYLKYRKEDEPKEHPDYGKPEKITFSVGGSNGGTGDTYNMGRQKENYVKALMCLWHFIKTLDYNGVEN